MLRTCSRAALGTALVIAVALPLLLLPPGGSGPGAAGAPPAVAVPVRIAPVTIAPVANAPVAGTSTRPLSEQGVHVIGDSVALGVHRSALSAENRPPRWTVDARGGRRMTALGTYYVPRTDRYWRYVRHIFVIERHRPMRTAVLELGTNGADHDMSVAEAAEYYDQAIRRVRRQGDWRTGPRRVVLVTPYKDPAIDEGGSNPRTGVAYLPYQWAPKNTVYAQAIHRVAAGLPHVCVADWRSFVAGRPWLLKDGIHPTGRGRLAWARIVIRAIDDCQE